MAKSGKKHVGRLIGAIILAVFIIAITLFGNYVSDMYHADETAQAAMTEDVPDGVHLEMLGKKAIAFIPDEPRAGLVFYPGGKVQPESYAPLLDLCAERGILCVLVKPLYNLAILDRNLPEGIPARFPDIDTWLVGGHSLGGVVAGMYIVDHPDEYDGIVFLAAYPSDDLSGLDVNALSVVGSNDGVLNHEKYEKAKPKLPANADEVVIEGGNHAGFGDYGAQKGDGEATIPPEEQQTRTADAIATLAKAS